jgi:serine/threonine protein phosphatase PrpC
VTGERKALIIANDEYVRGELRNLRAPGADADALSRVLGDPEIGAFAVQVIRNEPHHVIAARLEDLFADSKPDDVLLVHFSGHGIKNESGELFFAAADTRADRPGSTAVAADFIDRCMLASRSRAIVLLLDCCYSGAFAKGVRVRASGDVNVLDSFPRGRSGAGRGRAVITASSSLEFAFEADSAGGGAPGVPSVFTSALVEGLATGDADRDGDGWVSLGELYDYVFDKVRERTPHQTPSRRIELAGELYLARSARRARPEFIPADLRAALADANVYARLGALTELRSRLDGDDLPTASAAYRALTELARNAGSQLAERAAQALSQAAVRPEATELDFGQLEQGSPAPHRTIRLLGPPIARVCTLQPSQPWIQATAVDGNLNISIDTSASPGVLRGRLYLIGPTGDASIEIGAELLPHHAATVELPSVPPPQQPVPGSGGNDRNHFSWDLGQVAGTSDRGLLQPQNQDAMDIATIKTQDSFSVVGIVCDGMSHSPRADEASWAAVNTGIVLIAEGMDRGDDPREISTFAITAAERAVSELADPDGAPATTYVSAIATQREITVCWLGNSRAYWLADPSTRGGNKTDFERWSRQLTRDDALAHDMAAGPGTTDSTTTLPKSEMLTHWLGGDRPAVQAHLEQFKPSSPGVLLLCTDGLWNYCPDAAKLAAKVMPDALTQPGTATVSLVRFALDRGGRDNVTAVLIPFPPRPS